MNVVKASQVIFKPKSITKNIINVRQNRKISFFHIWGN